MADAATATADPLGSKLPVYLDNHASTPVDPRVAAVAFHFMTEAFGNASSEGHLHGERAAAAVSGARAEVAALLGAEPEQVVFTSGATEALNLGIGGLAFARARSGEEPLRIALPPTEHPAAIQTCRSLAEEGLARLTWIPVDSRGRLEMDALERMIAEGVDLVCAMAANNEIGTLHPVSEIATLCARGGARFLCDATQAAGKVPVAFEEWGIDLLAVTAHKMYGPQGVGALLVRQGIRLAPLLRGGGHQEGLRPGTLNLPGITAFGEACRLRRVEMGNDEPQIGALRDQLQRELLARIDGLVVNGDLDRRLSGNLHVSVPGAQNAAMQAILRRTVTLSTSSACSSGALGPSHVLKAIALPRILADGALRMGVGKFTTAEAVSFAAVEIARAAELAR